MAKTTELVFILDKSGSMGGLESDTIGGYNSFLKKQQKTKSDVRITTVLFDDKYELLHDRLDIKAVEPITDKDYFVEGSTALLDAVGKTIQKIDGTQQRSKKEYRADKVLFVITTDGMENASREYTYDKIKQMIEAKKEAGWEFIFLGSNIDAVEVAGHIGIAPNRSANHSTDAKGMDAMFASVSEVARKFSLSNGEIDDNWAKDIEDDYENREKD